MVPSMSAGPAAVFANLLASLGGASLGGASLGGRGPPVWPTISQPSGDLREEEGLVEDQQANTAGIPFAQPDDEDE